MPKRLHDRASLAYPDAVKEAARVFLVAYIAQCGIKFGKLRNLMMQEEDAAYDALLDKLSKSNVKASLTCRP